MKLSLKAGKRYWGAALKEVKSLNRLLAKDNYEETMTRKEVKETFKRIGLKPRHIKT